LAAYNRQATYIPWLSIAISLAVNRRQGNTNQQQQKIYQNKNGHNLN